MQCTNVNHGYFIRAGVPCDCAIVAWGGKDARWSELTPEARRALSRTSGVWTEVRR